MNAEQETAATAQFHAGLVMGAMSTHGCTFEQAVGDRARVALIGTTRTGRPLEVIVEVHA